MNIVASRFQIGELPKVERKKPQKFFSNYKSSLKDFPNFVEAQTSSFKLLIEKGLNEVFNEFAVIKDYTGKKFTFEFNSFSLAEPKYDEFYAKDNKISYESTLKASVKLTNKILGVIKEQEVFMADFPLMTSHGTFIISGVERVIVPQLARSFGVFFTSLEAKGKRYFGAKIIPARGVWIEIDSEPDGAIYVRIDRKRKFAVTSLLRVFGSLSAEDILKLISSNPEMRTYIEVSLGKDHAKTIDESYLEIHKRMRDGEVGSLENARQFVKGILLNEDRYDFSRVGRYRFNKRFKKSLDDSELNRKTLSLSDLITIISHIATLNASPDVLDDDIDHLGSRRVRFVGELLQQKLRVGMTQIKRNIQDRMSTIDSDVTQPLQFISPKPLQARIREFFTTNQLSQFMQQENILQEIEHLRTLSALGPGGLTRERAGFEVRDVHPSHYGRLCPIHTPEGPNIGLILRLATFARVNEFGMIETPYARVKGGKITKEIVYLSALEEESFRIAHAASRRDDDGNILEEEVEVRINGAPGLAKREEVDFIDVGLTQAYSIATSMIPFLDHDDANRALMGSNMQKQAVPCVMPEAPLVATGIEEKAARDSGRLLYAKEDGSVTYVDAERIKVKSSRRENDYKLINFSRTNGFTAFHQRPAVNVGDRVRKGDLIADTSSSDGGQMALGQNILVAFFSWSGANYEDAIIVSERLVKESKFTSIHIEEFAVNVRETKLGPEITTPDIPNVGEAKLRNLDEDGIVRVGAEVRPHDILVGKITPKGETQLTPEERLLRSLFGEKARDVKDTSKRMEAGKRGRVIGVRVFSRERGDKLESGIIKKIFIEVAELRSVTVGDKLAGRHGNKGVISKVLPEEDMPFLEDGTPVDIILTPLGVPSRMNLGQILELHLGLAANTLGYEAIVPPFGGASVEEIKEELKKASFRESGKMKLFDGRTGEQYEQEVAVGYMYIMKLHHMVVDKIHMRSIGPYSLITQQPLGGKAQGGGQRFGEMEVWALLGHGAAYTLREMLTVKSDDILGRTAAFDAIVRGERITQINIPASFSVLLYNLRGLALDVRLLKSGRDVPIVADKRHSMPTPADFEALSLKLASPEVIKEWSSGEVLKPETINYRTQRSEKNGLFDEKIFGPDKDYECYCGKYRGVRYKGIVCEKCGVELTRSIVRRERMGHIDLATPVAHIWYLRSMPSRMGLLLGIPGPDLEKVIYFAGYIITKVFMDEKERILRELDREYRNKVKALSDEKARESLKTIYLTTKQEIEAIREGTVVDEVVYHNYSLRYGTIFEAGIGAEAIYSIMKNINLRKLKESIEKQLDEVSALERERLSRRLALVKGNINGGIQPQWMFITRIPVIPAALRPMVPLDGGRYATSDVNDLYRRVINRNNRLKKLKEINAPEVILRNEKRILQEAVDSLIDNSIRHSAGALQAFSAAQRRPLKSLADNFKGKRGLFRQNLLGKRVDYSGRSVIVIGPDLKINQCGLPKYMALELFRPFVIAELLKRDLAYNIRGAGRLIDEDLPEVWAILEDIIKDKYVLLNRAPTLHRLGIQAFKPILIEGDAIQIHPLVCTAFNADFDGDQMAVHVPLGEEAQLEAREIMAADKNLLKPGSGDPIVSAKMLDVVLGCYWVTKIVSGEKGEGKYFPSPNSAITAFDFGEINLRAKIFALGTASPKYKEFGDKPFETTVGRLLFNSTVPSDYPYLNKEIERKSMQALVDDLIARYGLYSLPEILDRIKAFGFKFATYSGITWGIDDVVVPKEKAAVVRRAKERSDEILTHYNAGLLSKEERMRKNIEIWHAARNEVENLIPSSLDKNGSVYDMVYSGARGSLSQITQMAGMKGLIQSPKGETIEFPIFSCSKEGLTPIEYFITTHGSRKGLTDIALNTAKAGYLTRRLFDVAQDAIITEDDCGVREGIPIRIDSTLGIGPSFVKNIRGRILVEDILDPSGRTLFKKGYLLTKEEAQAVQSAGVREVWVRSPLTCKTIQGICAACYGLDLGKNDIVGLGEAVGTIAAQAIGEPGTQLTMRTFHAGGTAQIGGDITQGLPRVEEVFEKRTPKNPSVICRVEGEVSEIKDVGKEKIIVIIPERIGKMRGKIKREEPVEYTVNYRRTLFVKKGGLVSKGDILTDGSADIDELFQYGGKEKTQEYIISEVSKLYELQGETVARKHIEVIARQMFSRRLVTDPGDTALARGEIVDEMEVSRENQRLSEEGGKSAKIEPIILGITEVSLLRRSFLSAASFQHTTRVLIAAATRGAIDHLVGLKESVIIGRLIPAGSGFAHGPKARLIEELYRSFGR